MPWSYHHHPHITARKDQGPVKVHDQLPLGHPSRIVRFNSRFALISTIAVGSMWCAYLFALIAIAGLPTALQHGGIGPLFWFSSDFLQLTLLSVIIVGQNIQAKAADKRSEMTYLDAEAVLHEAQQIQKHLLEQDRYLTRLVDKIASEG